MAACEPCWNEAYRQSRLLGGSQVDHYRNLLEVLDGHPHDGEARPIPPGVCPTPGCPGDTRYAAPGRRHIEGCTYPIPPGTSAEASGQEGL